MKIVIIFLFSFFFINKVSAESNTNIYEKIDLFSEVLNKINNEYVEEVNQSNTMDAAINGVLQSLDPYSTYMSPEMFRDMQTETSGKFGGLGIEVGMEHGVIKVISPIDDSPASRVGVKSGDYIVKINDIQVQGKSLTEAVELMRGPVGSDIEITVRRMGVKKSIIFNITREIIKIESVKGSKYIDEGIGYLRLTSFNENSGKQIKREIEKFKQKQNVNSFILDLRNNPGGLLSQAIKITKVFPFVRSPFFANHFLFSDFFLPFVETISPSSRKKSVIFIAWDNKPPGLFLKSKIYPLRSFFLLNSLIFFLIWLPLFSLKEVSLKYPMLLSIYFDFADSIFIISLVILKIIAFFTPLLLTVISISDPTGPLINSTASVSDLPWTWISFIFTM